MTGLAVLIALVYEHIRIAGMHSQIDPSKRRYILERLSTPWRIAQALTLRAGLFE
jgi:hypothetical protein